MKSSPEYLQTDEYIVEDGVKKLRVTMQTAEFGSISSRTIPQTEHAEINTQLLNALGEELIQTYEERLRPRVIRIPGW